MIWLTWRQFRGHALVAAAALAAVTIYLVAIGLQIRRAYDLNVNCGAGCSLEAARRTLQHSYGSVLLLGGLLVLVVPALLGAFWGAPLIARELETGTCRLVWNQSVTRTRWLAVKLAFLTLAGVAVAGALSLLFTWAASPYDKLVNSRFGPMSFATRNVVPLGYAAFAVVAGITIGMLTRRTVMAMAITLAVFVALQILMPTAIRPHLRPPVQTSVAFSAAAADGIAITEQGVAVQQYSIPGAWVLTPNATVLDAAGNPVSSAVVRQCTSVSGGPGQAMSCLEAQHLHVDLSYQPADRYWSFQWLEFAVYLVLAGLLAGFAFWRIPRGLS